jgi:hypothetical protein
MGWIKNRINSEFKKHKTLDWSKIAESKINNTIELIIDEWAKEFNNVLSPTITLNETPIRRLKTKLEIKDSERRGK